MMSVCVCSDNKSVGRCGCFFVNRDAASKEAAVVVSSAQRVVVAPAWAPRDAVVQHHLEFLSSWHPDFEHKGSGRSVVQFEGVLPEAAPCVCCVMRRSTLSCLVATRQCCCCSPRGMRTRSFGCTHAGRDCRTLLARPNSQA